MPPGNMNAQDSTVNKNRIAVERNFRSIRKQAGEIADILEKEGVFSSSLKVADKERYDFVDAITQYAEHMDYYPFCVVDFEQSNVSLKVSLKKNVSTTGSDILITFEVSDITVKPFAKADNVQFCQDVEVRVREHLGLTDL